MQKVIEMNNNTDPLYNKTCALITMCIQTYGFGKTMEIFHEAIDDHIDENLQRESDEAARQFFNAKKRKLMELV